MTETGVDFDIRSLIVVAVIIAFVLLTSRANRKREERRTEIREAFTNLGDLFARELVAE